ncbi:MAG: helix-turn-helix domain-containing protein [Kordiimonadaceae bacterium]|nr:helix-turn-helix domain-containing protein [Kordiimonadaceae bacterium]
MKFGEYLRQRREANGWTQPEAAARADIEQSYLSKMENSKSYPSEEIFSKLVATYEIDVAAMSDAIESAELDRLREIADVRATVLNRQKNEVRFMRSWLVAGLIMVMIGGSALGLSYALPGEIHREYLYRSDGVILPGESPMSFAMLGAGGASAKNLSARVLYDYVSFNDNRGQSYINEVDGGFRVYTIYDQRVRVDLSPLRWLFAPAFMFILGGMACFYIARRWR